MLPVIHIGELSISTYTLMFNVGIFSMFAIMVYRKNYFDITILKAALFTVFMTISGILGTKILYCIEYFDEIMQNGLSSLGSPLFGAVFFVPVFMIPLCRLILFPKRLTTDACALCLPIMVGFLRFGCFFAGCCGGWTVTTPHFTFAWPTQAMDSVGNFLILVALLHFQQNKKYAGRLYPLYMMYYSIMRFFVEFLRDTEKDWFGLGHGQCFAILAFIIGFFWFNVHRIRTDSSENKTQ